MPVLINFKICDNAKECGGIAVCPTGALSYDEKKKTIVIDNDKCISCGICENECPIGAIIVAKTAEEYKNRKKILDKDQRTTKDLFVDRYGATPLSDFFMINEKELEAKILDNLVIIECYNDNSIQCLLKSIPIKELTSKMPKDTLFYKLEVTKKTITKFDIKELPALLVFKKGLLLGKINGYYSVDDKKKLQEKIATLVG